MSRLILTLILVAFAYYAGMNGWTHKDALSWLQDQGITEQAQNGADTAVQWLDENGVPTEKVGEVIDKIKPQ